jgi:hypothetical protein
MLCQSCKIQKSRLHAVESSLIPGMSLVLCTECRNKSFEPRHVIIIAAASGRDVKKHIVERLYFGDDLTAQEVIHIL